MNSVKYSIIKCNDIRQLDEKKKLDWKTHAVYYSHSCSITIIMVTTIDAKLDVIRIRTTMKHIITGFIHIHVHVWELKGGQFLSTTNQSIL